jgi:DNA-binding MarR family transcriptional regulator
MRRRAVNKLTKSVKKAQSTVIESEMAVFEWQPIAESLAQYTGNLLYWVSKMGAEFYATVLAELLLKPAHIAVLQVLNSANGLVQARLSDLTGINKPAMVGLLNELEARDFIERRPSKDDQRAFEIYLTPEGEEMLKKIKIISDRADKRFFGVLSESEQQQFREMLYRLATTKPPAD